jgi:hypothetical protein
MELSTISDVSGIELTEEAKGLIKDLVDLDSAHREEKIPLFKTLYIMWKNNATIAKAKNPFENNRGFIKKTIFNSLPAKDKKEMTTVLECYENIKHGLPYTTEKNIIIPSNDAEKARYKSIVHNHNVRINNRFNSLLKEFNDYVYDQTHYIPESILFAPLEKAVSTRENLSRLAKDKTLIEGYSGLSSSNPEGKKRKKGNTESDSENDEFDESDEVKLYYIYTQLICINFKIRVYNLLLYKDSGCEEFGVLPRKKDSQVVIQILSMIVN